jgi:hypothetical protein
MTRRTLAAVLCCLAVVLFLSRYAIALWYRGSGRTVWGPDDFVAFLRYVGIMPWVLAAGFLVAGIVYMTLAEREG